MNIALMAHDHKKDLMVQFCTAYAGILSQHDIFATNIATAEMLVLGLARGDLDWRLVENPRNRAIP